MPYDRFLTALKRKYDWEPMREYRYPSALTWNEVQQLAKSDMVSIGGHTITHPILPNCPSMIANREIVESKRMIEDRLGCEIKHFSYPNGDFTEREMGMVKQAGYVTARRIDGGWYRPNPRKAPFQIDAIGTPEEDKTHDLPFTVAGYHYYRRRFFDFFR